MGVRHLILTTLAFCMAHTAVGGPSSSGTDSYSVQDLTLCLYDYWAARIRSGLVDSEAQRDLARSVFHPSLVGTVSSKKDVLSNSATETTSDGKIGLAQTLLNLSQSSTIEAKERSHQAAQSEMEDQLWGLMKAFLDQAQNLQIARAQSRILAERIERTQRTVELMKELSQFKVSSPSDVLNAQSDLAQLRISDLENKLSVRNRALQIQAALGMDLNREVNLNLGVPPKVERSQAVWAKWVEQLPSLQALRSRSMAAQLEAKSADREWIPNLGVSATYNQELAGYSNSTNPRGLVVEGVLTVPLYEQGTRYVRAQQARAQKDVLEARWESKRNEVSAEVHLLLEQIRTLEESLEFAAQRESHIRKAYQAAWAGFSLGKSSFLNLKDVERGLSEAQFQRESLRIELQMKLHVLFNLELFRGGYTRSKLFADRKCKDLPRNN